MRSKLDMPVVRRVEGSAEEPDHGTNSNDSVADLDGRALAVRPPRGARARAPPGSGGVPTTRKPRSVRSRLQRARLRLGAVDEEVGAARALDVLVRLRLGHEREERAAKVVDPLAGRAREREDGDDPLVVGSSNVGSRREVDLVQDDDLRQLVEARAVARRARRRSSATAAAIGSERRSRGSACARARDGPGTRARARRPRLRPRSAPGRRRRRAGGRPSASTVPSIGWSVVNG